MDFKFHLPYLEFLNEIIENLFSTLAGHTVFHKYFEDLRVKFSDIINSIIKNCLILKL